VYQTHPIVNELNRFSMAKGMGIEVKKVASFVANIMLDS
jgi:hypothetical protein